MNRNKNVFLNIDKNIRLLNFEYFIARRLINGKAYKSSVSAPIIKIAIVAIALGIIIMLITIATGVGLQKKIREKVAAFNGHISISNYDNNSSQVSLTPIDRHQDFYPNFETVEGVDHIQAVASKIAVIRTETDFEGVVVKGVGTDYRWDAFKEYLIAGRLPNYHDDLNEEILISKYLGNRLGLSVGDKAITYFLKGTKGYNLRAFKIVGVYSSGFEEFDKTYLIADIRHIVKLNKWKKDEIGNFEVFIDDFDAITEKGIEIYQNTPSDLDSQSITLQFANIFEWLKLFDMNIIGIIGIIILVAGINMITALLVLILERTPLIGILKSLGMRNWSIRKIFLYNAVYLIVVGLFWGNFIGIGLLLLQDHLEIFKLNPETYYVNTAPVYLDMGHVLLLNFGTLVLCLLMLLIPSYVISKISPVKAIRFD